MFKTSQFKVNNYSLHPISKPLIKPLKLRKKSLCTNSFTLTRFLNLGLAFCEAVRVI